MKKIESFIESGILEMYVLGIASPEEIKQVEDMAACCVEITDEIASISEALKVYAQSTIKAPNNTIKPMILASVDYEERLKKGEQPSYPPILSNNSTIQDYSEWLNREDMVLPDDFNQVYLRIIGYTPEASTAIAWVQGETPYEIHTNEYEKFLILEGTCEVDIDGSIQSYVPGDYLSIPLHAGHILRVTSQTPCKVILQRIAA